MKVENKQVDALNIELTIQVEQGDYAEIERKKIAERRRTADFKGFRRGNVPESLIRRVYGEQILVDSVNEVVSGELQKYVTDNKLNLLGEPLSSERQPEVEWKDGNDFTFIFDLATYPEVQVEAGKDDTVPSYKISVSAKEKEEMKKNLKKFYEEKKGDKKEEKSDEEIEKEVSERLEGQYAQESEWRLTKDIREYFVKKAGVQLPEDFLKRWLFVANGGKVSKEDIEKDFDGFLADFRWQLVRSAFMKKYGFEVSRKEVEDAAAAYVTYQYAMYGLGNVPEEMLQDAVKNILSDSKQVDRMVEQVEDRKVLEALRADITIKEKKITSEKYRELK